MLTDGTRSRVPGRDQPLRLDAADGACRSASSSSTSIGDRITELLDLKVPEGIIGKLSLLPRLLEVAKFPPRMTTRRRAVPGGRLARRRGRSRQAADHHVLAGGRRSVHHAADGDHARSEARHSQRRHVPRAADGQDDARDALAAPQSRRRALARDGRARREDAGVHRARRRSRRRSTPRARRCRRRSTSSSSRDSCDARRCRSRRR